jgi:hypothetical protein
MADARPTGNLVPDAHLAALAVEHGLAVVSADSDFAKFAGVSWLNPCGPAAGLSAFLEPGARNARQMMLR